MPRRKIPGIHSLEDLLHIFLDLYEKDSIQLDTMLEVDPDSWLADGKDYVPLEEQIEIMQRSSELSRSEIERKTLIETKSDSPRHQQLRELIEKRKENDNWLGRFKPDRFTERLADLEGLPVDQFLTKEIHDELAKDKIDMQLLRFFADRLDSLVDAIEKLDETDFSLLVPEFLVAPFRELHVNAVLGNYGTALILCGALLEKALQDILLSDEQLNSLIAQAKTKGFIRNHNLKFADRIRDDRNGVVHGSIPFGAISSDYAWDTITWTRKLISSLYQLRKN